MSGRSREYLAALVLLAGGALLGVLSTGRTWGSAEVSAALGTVVEDVAGRDLLPYGQAAAWLALAALVAVPATRRTGRRVVGAVVAVAGAVLLVGAAAVAGGLAGRVAEHAGSGSGPVAGVDTSPGWAFAAAGAGLAVVLAGAWIAVRGPLWPGMGSRYERAPRGAGGGRDAWDSLDRGEDPTA